MELWPHQRAAVSAAMDAIRCGTSAGLWAMPTGCGKTVAFATLAKQLGRPTLVLVHRDELIRQTLEAFDDVSPGLEVGVVQAGRDEWRCTSTSVGRPYFG